MNKTAIKNFAIWARNKLISDITYKAGLLGITAGEIKMPRPQSTKDIQFFDVGTRDPYAISGAEVAQRQKLVKLITGKAKQADYPTAFNAVVEEVAYTWFNRLIAVRFMEINDYLPSRVRVLSAESGKIEPDIVTTPFDTGLEFTQAEKELVMRLKDDNKLDELLRFLFIKQCNALNAILPELFEKTDDYTELLLNISFTNKDGLLSRLVNDIPEEDWKDAVQIIGWLYQYYNTEPKQAVFDGLKKNVKISKEKIPFATQLFTPDWIVRYMVENSLGRLWLEGHPNNNLKANWKYYLDEAEQTREVQEQLEEIRVGYKGMSPENITFIDPCMGSGHILVYAFDVLIQIYESAGYLPRDAARLVLEKNLYGLDIDKRAYQLAYFALMMKARQYDRRFFENSAKSQVYHPGGWSDGEEFGSLVKISDAGEKPPARAPGYEELFNEDYEIAVRVWNFKRLLTRKFDVVCTNPPYMGGSGMNSKLAQFMKDNYTDSKSDLFAAFIERCVSFAKANAYQAMITQHAWMFLSSYEKLRIKLCSQDTINMAHLGPRAFPDIGGEVVQSTAFVLRNKHVKDFKGSYVRLVDFDNAEKKELGFLSDTHRYTASAENFAKIPGSPVAYWVGEKFYKIFSNSLLYNYSISDGQNKTGNNDRYLREFWEIDCLMIDREKKWLFYAKGGSYRKWHGNLTEVIDWSNTARVHYKKDRIARIIPEYLWYKPGITWSLLTSNLPSFRLLPDNATFDVVGSSIFLTDDKMLNFYLALLNSKVFLYVVTVINPTLAFQVRDIRTMPVVFDKVNEILKIVNGIVFLSRTDWDSFETSWDFKRHPLV